MSNLIHVTPGRYPNVPSKPQTTNKHLISLGISQLVPVVGLEAKTTIFVMMRDQHQTCMVIGDYAYLEFRRHGTRNAR